MAVIIDIDHESGDLTEYTSTVTDSGDLSVAAGAALAGSSYGLQCVIDDTTAIYGQFRLGSENTSGVVRARFYIDPNGLTFDNDDYVIVLYLLNGSAAQIARVYLYYTTVGGYQIYASVTNDAAVATNTSSYAITDVPHYIEIKLVRATGESTNDGSLQLWIDGVDKETVSGVDNYTRFAAFEYADIGARFIDAGTSGTLYIDELIVNDDGSEIGPVVTVVDLTATGVAVGAPSVGAPALGQIHGLTATGIATGSPSVGTPAITQIHILLAVGIAAGTPTVGAPLLSESTPGETELYQSLFRGIERAIEKGFVEL